MRPLRKPLYSERIAIERMGPARVRLHWMLKWAYRCVPDRVLFSPLGRPILLLWRLYRRTWP